MNEFYNKDIISIKDFSKDQLEKIFTSTDKMIQLDSSQRREICKGKTNQQIADDLFITLQTVKDHTHNIYKKVKVKNRVQLSQLFTNPERK